MSEFDHRAQSITRLYAQLRSAGFAPDDLRKVRDAHRVAATLFAGQLRPDGRPFVCHLVGVASILAMIDAPLDAIVAGLLHSAYTHGDFGSGRGERTRKAAAWLRERVGPDAERCIAAYAMRPFNAATVATWSDNVTALDAAEREIVLIRLADTLEDALDHGLQLSSKRSNTNRAVETRKLISLAEALGRPQLGVALHGALEERDSPELAALRDDHAGSYVVGPPSWREKWRPRVVRLVRRLRSAR
jgi:(p)ppGpp synthase/HD superfamily hydrolase